jgi:COMPASS component SWD3
MIVQYLSDEGYHAATMMILDEANLKAFERLEQQTEAKKMKKAILEGDWAEVDRLCARPFMRNHKSFLYAAYEQQYLEYIEHHEIQKVCVFLYLFLFYSTIHVLLHQTNRPRHLPI